MFTLLHNKVSEAGGRRHFCHHLKTGRHSGDSLGIFSSGAAPSYGQEERKRLLGGLVYWIPISYDNSAG